MEAALPGRPFVVLGNGNEFASKSGRTSSSTEETTGVDCSVVVFGIYKRRRTVLI
jgi:hypothetical protein